MDIGAVIGVQAEQIWGKDTTHWWWENRQAAAKLHLLLRVQTVWVYSIKGWTEVHEQSSDKGDGWVQVLKYVVEAEVDSIVHWVAVSVDEL